MLAKPLLLAGLCVLGSSATSCQSSRLAQTGKIERHSLIPTGRTQRGLASWYSVRTNGGRTTASGIPFSNNEMTAAHRSLPFGTLVRVTNKRNGRSQIVKITDRGPFKRGRIIDLSIGAADKLDMVNSGVVPVEMEVLRQPNRA